MGPAGPPGVGTDLLFTRAAAAFGDPVATKDALCTAELGQAFRTASTHNIASLYRTEFLMQIAGTGAFTTSNYTANLLSTATSNGVATFAAVGGAAGSVACVRLSASLQFTREVAAFGDPVSTKDALCVAELGPTYRAASTHDVAANFRAAFLMQIAGTGAFTTSNFTSNLLSTATSNGIATFATVGGAAGSVACVSM